MCFCAAALMLCKALNPAAPAHMIAFSLLQYCISTDLTTHCCCCFPEKPHLFCELQLERCVEMDSALEPVLRWKPVNAARLTVAGAAASRGRPWPRNSSNSSSSRVSKPGARVACASTAGGSSAGAGVVGGACSSGVGSAGAALSHDGQAGSCMSSM
jgi:hypothetical protein